MSIDEYIEKDRHIKDTTYFTIKIYTLTYLRKHQPFTYSWKLAKVAKKNYDISVWKSFLYGINKGFDYYNSRKNKNTHAKFNALVRTSVGVIDYVGNHMPLDEEDEYDES